MRINYGSLFQRLDAGVLDQLAGNPVEAQKCSDHDDLLLVAARGPARPLRKPALHVWRDICPIADLSWRDDRSHVCGH